MNFLNRLGADKPTPRGIFKVGKLGEKGGMGCFIFPNNFFLAGCSLLGVAKRLPVPGPAPGFPRVFLASPLKIFEPQKFSPWGGWMAFWGHFLSWTRPTCTLPKRGNF